MPRIARNIADGGAYHVLNRGNGRQRVFHKDGDYLAFISLLGEMSERFQIDLYAWCLMPDHFHLLVRVEKGDELSRAMQWCMTTHVRRYHRHYRSSGHIWQGRYKSFAVVDHDHFLTVARFVEGNPVRTGLVKSATDWAWSSHRERVGVGTGPLDKVAVPLIKNWGSPLHMEGRSQWTEYVDTPLTATELARIGTSVY